ncbi:hypothetical protein Tco_1174294 [Tanacetum coccineum]
MQSSMNRRICYIKRTLKESKTSRHVKRGRDTKIPQSSGPPKKVGDEAVHKELGDIMERAATTASSLEAEQDSGSVNAARLMLMPAFKFPLLRSIQSSTLPVLNNFGQLPRYRQLTSAKSTAWNEFSSTMASLIICLATNQKFNLSKYIFDAMVKHLDGGVKFLMYLHFLQVFINQQLGNMSHHKKIFVNPFHTKKVFANMKRPGKDFSRRITPLFDTMMVQPSEEVGEDSDHPTDSTQRRCRVSQDETEHKESVPTPSNDPQPSGEDSMQLTNLIVLCTKLQTQVLDLEKAKDAQAKEIAALKKRVQQLERKKTSRTTGLKRLKKGRSIADIDADVEVTLVDETQERQDDELMFDSGVLDTDEMPVEAKVDEKDEQSTKIDDSTAVMQMQAAKPKVVTTAATTTTTTRPKAKRVVVQEPSEFRVPQEAQTLISKDKGKGIMVEPEVPLKRKDQIALDEQIVRDIQAKLDVELIEEQKLARKQEEEANINID